MKYKMYRICLLMVAVAATTGGILYYCMCEKGVETNGKGTLVNQMQNTGSKIKRVGKHMANEVVNAVEQTGEEMKNAARNSGREIKRAVVNTGHEVKEAAAATGYEWKNTAKAVGREFKEEFMKNPKEQI